MAQASRTHRIQSMTGYASGTRETPLGQLAVEWRSVNSRYLDIAFRVPDELRAAEPGLRAAVTGAARRGKIECRISLRTRALGADARLDEQLLERLLASAAQLRERDPGLAPASVGDLLRFPGVFADAGSPETLVPQAVELGTALLADFTATREREGQRLVAVMLERLDAMAALVATLHERTPELRAAYEARLTERIETAIAAAPGAAALPADETMARIRQEVAAYGLKIDVAEEIDRLSTHIDECRRILAGAGPIGKRLDFMVQELNREANTLGSKAAAVDLTRTAVDLKVLIEQVREQVQNVE
ncbi:MAG: YicC/YloC family endoribonuclease [Burkholderiaceae bacterium]